MHFFYKRKLDLARALDSNIGIAPARIRRQLRERPALDELQPRRACGVLGLPSRITRWRRSLSALAVLAALGAPILTLGATQSITLAWNPSSDPTVVGYNLYHGVTSRNYTNMMDVGSATHATVFGLVEGTTYFIAVTAYNILGLESDYSGEVSYTVPAGGPSVQLRVTPTQQAVVTVTGQVGHTYDILATQTFAAWTVIGTVTLGDSGSSELIDSHAANFRSRFYRAQDTQP